MPSQWSRCPQARGVGGDWPFLSTGLSAQRKLRLTRARLLVSLRNANRPGGWGSTKRSTNRIPSGTPIWNQRKRKTRTNGRPNQHSQANRTWRLNKSATGGEVAKPEWRQWRTFFTARGIQIDIYTVNGIPVALLIPVWVLAPTSRADRLIKDSGWCFSVKAAICVESDWVYTMSESVKAFSEPGFCFHNSKTSLGDLMRAHWSPR